MPGVPAYTHTAVVAESVNRCLEFDSAHACPRKHHIDLATELCLALFESLLHEIVESFRVCCTKSSSLSEFVARHKGVK